MNFLLRLISSIILLIIVYLSLNFKLLLILILIIFCIISIREWADLTKNYYFKFFGSFFIILSFLSVFILRSYDNGLGLFYIIFILTITVSSDVGGFVFGKLIKGKKLTKISPNKTYAGVLGAYLLSIITSLNLFSYQNIFLISIELSYFKVVLIVFLLSTVSQLGDLSISYFKRKSNVKDTGTIIPGHGGLLDRIDGMIFVFPFFLIFLKIINI